MKVLHFINKLAVGGAETHLLDLCRAQKTRGLDVEVSCINDRIEDGQSLRQEFENIEVPVHTCGETSRYDARYLSTFNRLVTTIEPDIIHTHLPKPDLAGALVRKRSDDPGWITSVHDIHSNSWSASWALPLYRYIWNQPDAVIAISGAVKDWLMKDFDVNESMIDVIYYGLRKQFLQQFRPSQHTANTTERFTMGAIGRLEERKGHEVLIKALSRLSDEYSNVTLRIAGHDPFDYKKNLVELARNESVREQVEFTGFVDDIPTFLQSLDAYVFGSTSEGLGKVIIEAMAAGLPVIANDIRPISELLTDERHGFLVEQNTPEAFADRMEFLINHSSEASEMGKKGRTKVKQDFTVEAMTDQTMDVYRKVLGT